MRVWAGGARRRGSPEAIRTAGIEPLDPWAGDPPFTVAEALAPGPERTAAFRAVNLQVEALLIGQVARTLDDAIARLRAIV